MLQGFSGTDPCGKKLASLKFGEASDYIDVTASDCSGNWEATAYAAGSTDEDHQIISQTETWKGGEQATIIIEGPDPIVGQRDRTPAATKPSSRSRCPTSIPRPNAVPGKGLVIIGAASVQYTAGKDTAWVAGLAGQTKCLTAVGDTDDHAGPTSAVRRSCRIR